MNTQTDQNVSKFRHHLYEDDEQFNESKYRESRANAPKVAWTILGWELEPDEDTEWSGYYNRSGQILAIMVGDDRPFRFDVEDLTPIRDDDYCPGCGQIGCHCYR